MPAGVDLAPLEPRFDWYQGTVLQEGLNPEVMVEWLEAGLGAVSVDDQPGRYGYGRQSVFRGPDGGVLCRAMYGGSQPWPTVWGSGSASPAVADLLRSSWPHRVTRLDSAVDWEGPTAWPGLRGVCVDVGMRRGVKLVSVGDVIRQVDGETLYVGSRASSVFARAYQKGLQIKEAGRPDWCRLELVVRPQKEARHTVAHMSPAQVWGVSPWARDLLQSATGLDVPRVAVHTASQGDDDRALRALTRQYGAVLSRLRDRLGSAEAVGAWLLRSSDQIERSEQARIVL